MGVKLDVSKWVNFKGTKRNSSKAQFDSLTTNNYNENQQMIVQNVATEEKNTDELINKKTLGVSSEINSTEIDLLPNS